MHPTCTTSCEGFQDKMMHVIISLNFLVVVTFNFFIQVDKIKHHD